MADPDEQNGVSITLGPRGYTITDTTGVGAGQGCVDDSPSDPDAVTCPAEGVTALRIELGEGNDGFASSVATPATILGGGGNDQITGGSGPDSIIGEAALGASTTGTNTLNGGGGNDDIDGGGGVDTVDGGDGNDDVAGAAGNDALRGGAGDDIMRPGPGPAPGDSDSDTFVGGPGVDHATFETRSTPVSLTLDGQPNDGAPGENDDVQPDVEQLTGGSAADVLGGNGAPNTLSGGPGGDRLGGDGGDDVLDGGGDADVTDGGEGDDSVAGGAGTDDVAGGPGDDLVNGSAAALVGADGNDRVAGGEGNDLIAGGDADDALDGGPGADVMSGGPGSDTAEYATAAAAAKVTVSGATAANVRISFNDRADDGIAKEGDNVGSDVENALTGGGDDTLRGGGGANRLTSGSGEDFLVGDGGGDVMLAGDSRDVVMARDNAADGVDCGAGRDFAVVDKRETSTSNCEFLDKGGRKPKLGRRFVLRPVRGKRLGFGAPGMTRWVPLGQTLQLPVRSRVRARGGAVRLVAAGRRGRQSALFGGGSFLVKQPRRGGGLTELRMASGDFSACAAPGEATTAGRRRRVRRIFGRGRGRFRTRGRNSSATVRGTSWTMVDRCDGTLTKVRRGTVVVRDFQKRRTVVLRAGDRYLAKSPRR